MEVAWSPSLSRMTRRRRLPLRSARSRVVALVNTPALSLVPSGSVVITLTSHHRAGSVMTQVYRNTRELVMRNVERQRARVEELTVAWEGVKQTALVIEQRLKDAQAALEDAEARCRDLG